ncbi:MAG: cyclic nucleotide-binding/CBS domain-containing protein [Alphaproteobacteria bacterium]
MVRNLRIIPDIVEAQSLVMLAPDETVAAAAQIMAERRLGAVMVVKAKKLVGIFTERDMVLRVVAAGLNPTKTKLAAVMTANPDTLAPDDFAREALDRMATKGYRHLPVVENGRPVGMVSVRDLYAIVVDRMEFGIVRMAERLLG